MKKILRLSFLFVFAIGFSNSWAQERSVSGKVTSIDDGTGLPGVNVVIKGTTTGTITDVGGFYKLNISEGATLVFSFIGYSTEEIDVGSRTLLDLSLSSDIKQLSEVIVTAAGIKRERKALGYSVTTVGAEDIEQKSEGDIGRVLRGKVAGVNITQASGLAGSGTNIIIRGFTSVTGNNQPLFIVDGVPFDGGSNQQQNYVEGQTESSRFLDLDPNSIESVSVLKGLSATVLYGQLGRNGVILITTKNGATGNSNRKTEISLSQSYFQSKVASLPDYQDNYGGGFHQNFGFFFSNWGPNFATRGEKGIDANGQVDHPYSKFAGQALLDAFPEYQGQKYDYKAYDNVEKFFRTGTVASTSLNVRGGSENVSFNASYGHTKDVGFTPGNELTRDNFGFGGNAKLSNKFTVGGTFNFTNTRYETPPVAASLGSGIIGGGSSVFGDLLYTPRSVDLNGLPYQNPITGGSVYYRSGNDIQNPNWTVNNSGASQNVDRFYGNTSISYEILDWLNATYRVGLDTYTEQNRFWQNKNGVDGDVTGMYRTISVKNKIWDHNFMLSGTKELTEDITLRANIGFNARRDEHYEVGVESTGQVVFGVLRHYNFLNQSGVNSQSGFDIEYEINQNVMGAYAQFEGDYRGYLFLTLSGRNDWGNTVEKENRSLFYPGASLAFDATSAIGALQNSDLMNYLKLRVGYGSSANYPGAYSTRGALNLTANAFVDRNGGQLTTNAVSRRLGNPNLTPSSISEIELGVESEFFNSKLGLDVSVFKKNTTDLILDQSLDPSTGYDLTRVNSGELEVKGLEIEYRAAPVKLGDFAWNVSGNWVAMRTTMVSLPDGTEQIAITPGITDIGNYAIAGEPYGVIQGTYVETNDAGEKLVDSNGLYVISSDIKIIGDPNPDWTTSLSNNFSFKGIKLGVEMQYTHGGDFYSRTAAALVGRGITKDTDFDRTQAYVLPGVSQSDETSQNQVIITATNLYFDNNGFGPDSFKIWDGTTIRLSEVSLGYTLPKSLIDKTPFGMVSINATGYNMWYKAVNFPEHINFDTNATGTGVGNGMGLDFISSPSSKRYGASIKITF